MMSWYEWKPYVPVAKRRENAKKEAAKMAKKGQPLEPIELSGTKIAKTFWGKAWCDNLERYSDYANRMPRGRTYVRNGSVIDLKISEGKVTALVSGSELYKVKVDIEPIEAKQWKRVVEDCSRSVDSLIDLLQARFSKGVMERLTRQKEGLFPQPKEIRLNCSCPDSARMCKHVAAVLYGVGARLDADPQLLFKLRKVDHQELIREAVDNANLDAAIGGEAASALAGEDLGAMFGIDLATSGTAATTNADAATASPKKRRGWPRKSSPGEETSKTETATAPNITPISATAAVKATKKPRSAAKPAATAPDSAKSVASTANAIPAKRGRMRAATASVATAVDQIDIGLAVVTEETMAGKSVVERVAVALKAIRARKAARGSRQSAKKRSASRKKPAAAQ